MQRFSGRLRTGPGYTCPKCCGTARPIDGRIIDEVVVDEAKKSVEHFFCYLGDMLCVEGGVDLAVTTRCSVAWDKFKSILPILTSKHVSLKTRGKLYSTVVQSAMLHGCETWAPTADVIQCLQCNDRSMIC